MKWIRGFGVTDGSKAIGEAIALVATLFKQNSECKHYRYDTAALVRRLAERLEV